MARRKKPNKGRYDLYGKYNLNLEEIAILNDFLKIDGKYIVYDERKKEFILFNSKKNKLTSITPATFPNVPRDIGYEIEEILK